MANIVIEVENLSKAYQLGQIGTGTISKDMERWWITKIRGKEDPFLKIGETNDRSTKGKTDFVWSLQDINFKISQGDTLGIIGKNGAGKSTLLKVLSRITSPTRGNIKIMGRVASLLEVGTGFHPELTGKENIFLNGAILGMRKKEISRKLDEIIDFSGVERYIDTPVKRYSSGMYVRLAFAVAANLESEILIVDEVLAVGDAEFQKKCLGKMNDISKTDGRAILFVSHNMNAIKSLCKNGIVLENGRLLYSGTAMDAIHAYSSSSNNESLEGFYVNQEENPIGLTLTEARLKDEKGDIKIEFECDELISLSLKLMLSKSFKNVQGYIAIYNSNEEVFIESDTFDFLPNILDGMSEGIREFEVSIPKRVLPVGQYYVYLNFSSAFEDNFSLGPEKAILNFSVIDSHTNRGLNRKAYSSAILKWGNK